MAGAYDLAGTMVDYFLSEPQYENPYYTLCFDKVTYGITKD